MDARDARPGAAAPGHLLDLQFLRAADVCALLRISRPTLWRMRRDRQFPLPTSLSQRSIGWRRSDVESWLRARAQSYGGTEAPPRVEETTSPVAPARPARAKTTTGPATRKTRARKQLPLSLS